MADLKYSVEIDTRGATSALNGLKAAIAGVVAGLTTGVLVDFADSITSLKNKLATITPELANVDKQFKAIAAIAISSRTPLEQTGDLYFRIARAADDLGISQQEAANITDSVAKAISATGLSAQEAAGPLLQLGQALQSGRFQGDELRSILEGMPVVAKAMADSLGVTVGELRELGSQGKITGDVFVQAMRKAKDSIDEAFLRTQPTIKQAFETLKTSSKLAFDEFEKNSKTGASTARVIEYLGFMMFKAAKNIDEFIGPLKILIQILATLATFTIVGRVIRAIGAAFTATSTAISTFSAAATGAVSTFRAGFASLGRTVEVATWYIARFMKGNATLSSLLVDLGKRFAFVRQGVGLLGKAFVSIKGYLLQLATAIASFLGIDALIDKIKEIGSGTGETADDMADFRKELANMKNGLDDTAGAGASAIATQKELARAAAEAAYQLALEAKQYHDAVAEQKKNLKTQMENIGVAEDILRVRENLLEFDRNYAQEEKRLSEAIAKASLSKDDKERKSIASLREYLKQLRESRDADRAAIEGQTQAINEKLAADRLQQYQTEALIKANEELQKVQDDIAKLTMTEMEKKYYDIDRAAKQAAESAIRAEEKIRGRKLTTNEAKAYYDAAKQGAEELKTANQDLVNQSMTFDTGWKQALNNYLTESTDKAAQAKRVFEGFTKGIEDAFVNFAKTGKLSFKDLLNFMLEEFVRSNVRNLFADIFGGGGSGGSTIGSIFKSIFGLRADGGPAQANKPYIVGEEGPELFVPKGTGTVLPNGVGMGGTTNNTYITNNIQAVDAKSVAQLFATNRKALLGSVEMARKELPY